MSRDPASRIEQALRRVERDDIHSLDAVPDHSVSDAEIDDFDDEDAADESDAPQIR